MLTVQRAQAELTGNRLDRRMLDGREYAVAPAVLIKEGVLNGQFVPSEEIAAFVDAWNGRPIPVRHPQVNGEFVSANSPTVLETSAIGSLFGAMMDGGKLKGELWIDTAKAAVVGGDALTLLARMDAGQTVELSTAYYCDVEATSGYHKGTFFEGIQRNLRPDHVALLPDEVGACSVADGCGAPRVNAERGMRNAESQTALVVNQTGDGDYSQSVMVAFYLRPEDAQPLALAADALPGGSVLPANQLHVTLAYLGDIADVAAEFNLVARTLGEVTEHQMMVLAQTCGMGRFANPASGQDAIFLLVESEPLHQFRDWLANVLNWDVDVGRLHGFVPHITLGYVPSDSPVTLAPVAPTSLIFDQVALSWGATTIVFDLNGQLRDPVAGFEAMTVNSCRCSEENGSMEKEQEQAKVVKKTEGKADIVAAANAQLGITDPPAPVVNATKPAFEMPAELAELAGLLREMGGAAKVRDALQSVTVNAARQKDEMIGRLVANTQCAFTKEDMAGMSLEALSKLERSLRPMDYSGRAGVVINAFAQGDEWEPYVAPKVEEGKK